MKKVSSAENAKAQPPRKLAPYPAYRDSGVEWLGAIPAHWKVKRLKDIASVRLSNVDKKSVTGELAIRLCNYTDVYYHDRITPDIDFMIATASTEQIRRFHLKAGDVLITKDSESWDDIAIPSVVESALENVLCGYHLALLRPTDSVSGPYLSRALGAPGPREQFRVAANGITRYGLGADAIATARIAIPALPEQRAIAAFLDKETARIDALIAKRERLIELLQEQRTALITRAVTKGLDSNAPMKDSGVEWLGSVPKYWNVKKMKRLCLVRRGASPRPIDDPTYFDDDGEYAWVRIADVTASERYLEHTTQRLSDAGKSKSVPLEPGELFVSIAGTVGVPVITKIKCCIHDGFVYFVGLKTNREFLFYLFSCGEPYKGLGKLGTQLNLNTDTIGNICVPQPPAGEQNAIVEFLDRQTARIDRLIANVVESSGRLNELRGAIISAAVTGKIDVRKEAA